MSYLPKKVVLAGIKSRTRTRNGNPTTIYEAYFGYDPFTKKPKRLQGTDLKRLKEDIERFYIEHKTGGDAAARLSPVEALDAREAIDTLSAHQMSISLTECVRRFLAGQTAADKSTAVITVGAAYEKFLAAQFGKSKDYLRSLRSHVGKWIELFGSGKPITDVTPQQVKDDLTERLVDEDDQKTWKTYNNHLGDIKTFMSWCAKMEQHFIDRSPLEGMAKLKPDWKDPEYMKAADVAQLFAVMRRHADERPQDLAYAVLSFFCGMRQSEIARTPLGKDAINISIEDRFIRVGKPKGITNGVKPRCFTIPDQALAWMRGFDFMAAIVQTNPNFRRRLVIYAEEAKIKLPGNCGRHTFITMHSAAYHDPKLLSSIVGNSEDVRANAYDGIVSEKEGREYFAILPEPVQIQVQNSAQTQNAA